jgi:hypothetical protein
MCVQAQHRPHRSDCQWFLRLQDSKGAARCAHPADPALLWLQAEAGGTLQQQIFLSTDDPAAITWFSENATGWQVSYTNSSRKPDQK